MVSPLRALWIDVRTGVWRLSRGEWQWVGVSKDCGGCTVEEVTGDLEFLSHGCRKCWLGAAEHCRNRDKHMDLPCCYAS